MADRPAKAKKRNCRYGLKALPPSEVFWFTQSKKAWEVKTMISTMFEPTHANTTFVLLFRS